MKQLKQLSATSQRQQPVSTRTGIRLTSGLLAAWFFGLLILPSAHAGTTKVDITNIQNAQVVSVALTDQVLTGTQASFQATISVDLDGKDVYYLRWSFMGTTSQWFGPLTAAPTGGWTFNVPSSATHKLNESVMAEVRINTNGTIHDSYSRDMKVLFNANGTSDTHNRPSGNADANWFRHWGADHDNAVDTYRATGSVTYYGEPVTFSYGGSGSADGSYLPGTNTITLYESARGSENFTWSSAANTYTDSLGNTVNAPAGAITINVQAKGIDRVKHIIAHEVEHFHVNLRWRVGGEWRLNYGPRVTGTGTGSNDRDGDWLPDLVEDDNPGLNWNDATSDPVGFGLGDDQEVWAENVGQSPGTGTSANDWSYPGKQSMPAH